MNVGKVIFFYYIFKMDENNEALVELLIDILGDPKRMYESKGQYSFNCCECDDGRNKGNLEVNIFSDVYKCWSCSDINDMHGHLGKLISTYGSKKQKKLYEILKPEEVWVKEKTFKALKLPESYTKFSESNPRFIPHREAYNYLKNRGITNEMIEKYEIGYCHTGDFAYRIIIPSYDNNGKLNYFIGRSWLPKTKAKYRNAEAPKDEIIFNESKINWNNDIYLCEGVFDGLFLPNPVILLGKVMSELMFTTIYEKAKGNIIICLDGDAFKDAKKIYNTLNGGRLQDKIQILKLPENKDIAELHGEFQDYYYEMKY